MGMDQPPYGQQPSYGAPQPSYGANVPPAGNAGSKWGPTSMGMEAHIAGGLSYIWILGVIFFFVEKSNRFVRFHAAQSILLGIAGIVLTFVYIALVVISGIIASNDPTGATGFLFTCIFTCIPGILALGLFGLFIWGLIAGFTGKYVKMPVIGDIAEKMAGGGPVPAM